MQLFRRLFLSLPALLLLALPACDRSDSPADAGGETGDGPREGRSWFFGRKTPPKPTPEPAPTPPPAPAKIWEQFSGEKAFLHVRELVKLGPRPAGSERLEEARSYIIAEMQKHGWEVERQTFTEMTPRGEITFVNLIARFSRGQPEKPASRKTQRALIGSHYDTKLFETIEFVGAHDGGSSTGALIELARVLSLDWNLASQMELVFFDGEEALVQFTASDGLYGSRYYARQLRKSGRADQFQFGIIWDMIGDRDLTITFSPDAPGKMVQSFFAIASRFDVREHFGYHKVRIIDDDLPLNQSGIPTINLIDFDYPYWHTADDTLDKLAPESLEIIGEVTLYYLWSNLTFVAPDQD